MTRPSPPCSPEEEKGSAHQTLRLDVNSSLPVVRDDLPPNLSPSPQNLHSEELLSHPSHLSSFSAQYCNNNSCRQVLGSKPPLPNRSCLLQLLPHELHKRAVLPTLQPHRLHPLVPRPAPCGPWYLPACSLPQRPSLLVLYSLLVLPPPHPSRSPLSPSSPHLPRPLKEVLAPLLLRPSLLPLSQSALAL